jgi:hypothetical protein
MIDRRAGSIDPAGCISLPQSQSRSHRTNRTVHEITQARPK